jgi:hypothetical protein
VIKDFLAAAREEGFAFDTLPPTASPAEFKAFEHRFKISYAKTALAFGLTSGQVLGVYAFETGGNGFHTEQPISNGRAISTALGYAQLLAANSVNTIAAHGERIAAMLEKDGKFAKAALVRRMQAEILAAAGGHVPDVEVDARALGRTTLGRAVHAANLDRDIGPYIQSVKLADIIDHYREQARANGMPEAPLEPWRLEGMNLAGLVVGFQMDHPTLAKRLSLNFFKEDGYEANPVVGRGHTAEGVLAIIRDGMQGSFTRAAGYREMKAIFDGLTTAKRPTKARGSR